MAEVDEYRYRYHYHDGRKEVIALESLADDFKAIFEELKRFRHDEEKFRDILTRCPSDEGGMELFTMWELSTDQGLRIVGRMAVLALADHIGLELEDLLRGTYSIDLEDLIQQ